MARGRNTIGVTDLLHTSWRPSPLEPMSVHIENANYGTMGSHALWRNRRTDTIVAPPEPRQRMWNALLPIVWRFRVLDAAKLSAVQSRAPGTFGAPVTFAPPKTAQLAPPRGNA